MSTPEARCVWLTEEDLDGAPEYLWERFRAAPADPAEIVRAWFDGEYAFDDDDITSLGDSIAALLVSLGYPDGSPRQENPT